MPPRSEEKVRSWDGPSFLLGVLKWTVIGIIGIVVIFVAAMIIRIAVTGGN